MTDIYRIYGIQYQLIFGIFIDHFGGPLYMANVCRNNEILYQLIFGIFRDHFLGFCKGHFLGISRDQFLEFLEINFWDFYRSYWRSFVYDQHMSY